MAALNTNGSNDMSDKSSYAMTRIEFVYGLVKVALKDNSANSIVVPTYLDLLIIIYIYM